jgi:hypothetical protein
MAIVKKVVEANSSCMADLSPASPRIGGASLGVAKQYERTVSEGLPQGQKMASSEPHNCVVAL